MAAEPVAGDAHAKCGDLPGRQQGVEIEIAAVGAAERNGKIEGNVVVHQRRADRKGSEPPERLGAVGGLQLLSPTSGNRTGHQPARSKRPGGGIEHPDPHPALIHTRRLELNANGERGGHGETGRSSSPTPPPGAITATADPVPRPPLWLLQGACPYNGCSMAAPESERPRETGPRRTPPRGGPWPLRAPRRCPPAPPAACGRWRGR